MKSVFEFYFFQIEFILYSLIWALNARFDVHLKSPKEHYIPSPSDEWFVPESVGAKNHMYRYVE